MNKYCPPFDPSVIDSDRRTLGIKRHNRFIYKQDQSTIREFIQGIKPMNEQTNKAHNEYCRHCGADGKYAEVGRTTPPSSAAMGTKLLTIDDTFDFGKHTGKDVVDVLDTNPSYFSWLHDKGVRDFCPALTLACERIGVISK
jgi:hypothetical protein